MIFKMKARLPLQDKRQLLYQKIKDLYSLGYNYSEIAEILRVSATLVFFVIKGRPKKAASPPSSLNISKNNSNKN